MSNIWVCFCSARPAPQAQRVIDAWRDMGYRVCVLRPTADVKAELCLSEQGSFTVGDFSGKLTDLDMTYRGWSTSMNTIHKVVLGVNGLGMWPHPDWIASAADDVLPDPKWKPREIAQSCRDHFKGSLGVMQPFGDDWYPGIVSVGHPWLGRDYILRANQGKGPFWPGYYHYYADMELGQVSQQQGLLWLREDLTHKHENWSRMKEERPALLDKAYAKLNEDKALYEWRTREGFPGSELL